MVKKSANYLKLCLVTDVSSSKSLTEYLSFIDRVARNGVTCVQLREKNLSLLQLKKIAHELKAVLQPFNIPLIINDHIELAKEIGADGIHLGQTDISPQAAREILGPEKIIGLSIENLTQLQTANQLTALNYVAASAIFYTPSKPDCKTLWGLTGLQQFSKLSYHPVIAIGGININNVTDVIAHGAQGVAVISALHQTINPEFITKNFINKINKMLTI